MPGEIPSYKLFRVNPEVPKIMQGTTTVLGFPPELDDNIPLLQAPHILVVGHRQSKLELKWKLPPNQLAFTVLWEAMYAAREKIKSVTLPSYVYQSARQGVASGITVAWLLWGNELLCGWIWGLFEFMPGTINLDENSWLSWRSPLSSSPRRVVNPAEEDE